MARSQSLTDVAEDLWELLRAYARQETLDPFKSLGRYVGFGLAGMLLTATGLVFIGLAGLRAMQEQTEVFEGFWSWAPYLIVVVTFVFVCALAVSRIRGRVSAAEGDSGSRVRSDGAPR